MPSTLDTKFQFPLLLDPIEEARLERKQRDCGIVGGCCFLTSLLCLAGASLTILYHTEQHLYKGERFNFGLNASWIPRPHYPGYLADLAQPTPQRAIPQQCETLVLDKCARRLAYNSTGYPNLVDHSSPQEVFKELSLFRQIIDSECDPSAADFICQLLQPECKQSLPLRSPCKDFCNQFHRACGSLIPEALKDRISCDALPNDSASCRKKPECVTELKHRRMFDKICDGILDCDDFTDESNCNDLALNITISK